LGNDAVVDNTKEEKVYDVEEIDRRKKLMEQQNTNKKQLLTQALAHQRNKTRQQSVRLRQIEAELKHLDVSLALDVNRVRQRVSCLLGLLRGVVGNLLLYCPLFSHILLLSVVRTALVPARRHACAFGRTTTAQRASSPPHTYLLAFGRVGLVVNA
jgi:hypothetical protein